MPVQRIIRPFIRQLQPPVARFPSRIDGLRPHDSVILGYRKGNSERIRNTEYSIINADEEVLKALSDECKKADRCVANKFHPKKGK